mgnify:CR=1 FL=1
MTTLYYFFRATYSVCRRNVVLLESHFTLLTVVIATFPVFTINFGFQTVANALYFVAYWVFLGFISSAGIGFGFHTFMLYVLPAIAADHTDSTFLETFLTFLPLVYAWGFGNAVGECTGYIAGYVGTDEASTVRQSYPRTYRFMQKYSFWTILLNASVPNNFFDVLGIMSGAMRLPFMSFFIPTLIGKMVIKSAIQLAAATLFLDPQYQQKFISMLPDMLVPSFQWLVSAMTHGDDGGVVSYVSIVKDIVITVIILYFAMKGVNKVAAYQHNQIKERRREHLSKMNKIDRCDVS